MHERGRAAEDHRLGERPVARTLRVEDFPRLGPVDVVLGRPAALVELKWSYALARKVFESLWDALKLGLLGETLDYDDLYTSRVRATKNGGLPSPRSSSRTAPSMP